MERFTNGNLKFLVGGWIAGVWYSLDQLFIGTIPFFVFVMKFVGLVVAGFLTGFFTSLGNDFYKLKVKGKLLKLFGIKPKD